jgi:16S rRNA (cytosine1402-N4)-methyltransferase
MHISVLRSEVIRYLDPRPGENFIDGTCGNAGHALEILKRNEPGGRILCLDWDERAIESLKKKLNGEGVASRVILVNDNFANLEKTVAEKDFFQVSGILLDLGMSSDQLEVSGRGFSFLKDEVLDMRYSDANNLTAREIVNQWPQLEIERILKDYGQEHFASRIASEIVKSRKLKKIETTAELVRVLARAIPEKYKHGRTNFATRTFQALRIAVNGELENLQEFLPQALKLLGDGGRLVIISFQSLEDRIVKNFFRQNAQENKLKILTKKPIQPTLQEQKENPRSRSAKLRAAIKIEINS